MAVLIEALSVIIRCDAIETRYLGGRETFLYAVPNQTLCADEQLARVGFMMPKDVKRYIERLEQAGLIFTRNNKSVDIVVFDQITGPSTACDWIEYADIPVGDEGATVRACWFYGGSAGYAPTSYLSTKSITVSTPKNWKYAGSMSAQPRRINEGDEQNRLTHLDSQGGIDSYIDNETDETIYIGRPRKH